MRWLAASVACVCSALLGCEPMGPIAGGRLSGEVVSDEVADWSFTDSIETIELETRPSDPHSITVWCYVHEGKLYIPSRAPTRK